MKSASGTDLSNTSLNISRKIPKSQNKSFTPQLDSVRIPGFSTDVKQTLDLNLKLELIDFRTPPIIERNKRNNVSAAEYKSAPKKSRLNKSNEIKNIGNEERMPVFNMENSSLKN